MAHPPEPQTLAAMLATVSTRHAERILARRSSDTLSYGETNTQSAEIALGLMHEGVGKGTRVGILMPNSPAWITSWFAVTRIGALAMGISTFLKPKELAWIVRFADLDTLIVADTYLNRDYIKELELALPSLTRQQGGKRLTLPEAPFLRHIWTTGTQNPPWASGTTEALRRSGKKFTDAGTEYLKAVEANVMPSDHAAAIFTSGTTADPKGVLHSHGTIVRRAYEMFDYGPCKPGEKVGVLTPLFWVGGLLTNLLNTMIGGGTLVFPERPDADYLVTFLRRERLDYLNGWSGQFNAIKAHPDFTPELFQQLKPANGTQLRAGIIGPPSPLPPERISSMLGMTESFGPHSGELPEYTLTEAQIGSYGRAIGNVEWLIVEPGTRRELPTGKPGELLIRRPDMFDGYYKREHNSAFEVDGFFRTGDRCHISHDGHLYFHGRIGGMIKTSGANVSPEEVEQALLSMPEIEQAYVLGIPDRQVGERVEAVIVLTPDKKLSEQEVINHLKGDLSTYKVPKRVTFMQSQDIPLSASHKVQKHKLIEMIMQLGNHHTQAEEQEERHLPASIRKRHT